MKRMLLVLTVALMMVGMMLALAVPAFAAKPPFAGPDAGPCIRDSIHAGAEAGRDLARNCLGL